MTYFVQLVHIQKEMKLCNQARVLISKEKLLYLHPKSSFFRFVSDLIIIFLPFDHQVCFLMNIFGKRTDLPFFHSRVIVRKRKAWFRLRVSRILLAAKTQLYDIAHQRTIICRHLLAGQVVGFRPMKRKKTWHCMINYFQPLFVISDSYGLHFQPPRRLKHFLYHVSEPIVGAKSLLEDIC